ncbi:MAG: rhomboid family intramembrane serine protease [Maricaulaceae bacterium]
MNMSTEPMFNLREKAPVIVFAILIIFHILLKLTPTNLAEHIYSWLLLLPLGYEGINGTQNFTSLLGHGLAHGDISHLIMNGFMIIAFGVVTLQGIRANISIRPAIFTPVQKFYLIFILGIVVGGLFQWGWWAISHKTGVALGASGGASALFATMAYAIGGRDRMLKFGIGWGIINILLALVGPSLGINIAWAANVGGYVLGMILARIWVRSTSTSFKLN